MSTVKITAGFAGLRNAGNADHQWRFDAGAVGWLTVMVAVPLASEVPWYSVAVVVNSVLSSTTGALLFTAPGGFQHLYV